MNSVQEALQESEGPISGCLSCVMFCVEIARPWKVQCFEGLQRSKVYIPVCRNSLVAFEWEDRPLRSVGIDKRYYN